MKYIYILILLLLVENVAAKEAKQILSLGYIEFPPYTFTDSNKKPAGTMIDLAKKLVTQAGYQFRAIPLPTKRLFEYLKHGEVDMWLGVNTIESLDDIAYVGTQAIGTLELRAYYLELENVISTKEQLDSKSVIVMRGYSYGGLANYIFDQENQIKYLNTDSYKSGFNMLFAKRADYFLAYRQPAELVLALEFPDTIYSSELLSMPFYFVIGKHVPDAKQALSYLEREYAKHTHKN